MRARGDTVTERRTGRIGPSRSIRGLTGQHSVREGPTWGLFGSRESLSPDCVSNKEPTVKITKFCLCYNPKYPVVSSVTHDDIIVVAHFDDFAFLHSEQVTIFGCTALFLPLLPLTLFMWCLVLCFRFLFLLILSLSFFVSFLRLCSCRRRIGVQRMELGHMMRKEWLRGDDKYT